jgi:IS30 family transposase
MEVVLSTIRRVKKGPGRRPQSAKRQWFMELRARGWSVLAAAREIGISRTAANNWARGYKTYRNGESVGFIPPLDRFEVRQISDRYLSQDERIEIADLRQAGMSIRQISRRLSAGLLRRSRGSCTETPPPAGTPATDRSTLTASRSHAGPATTAGVSRRTLS